MTGVDTGPPRPITGSVGSRIRLIMGDTGSEWLLLLNEDDGDMEWQSRHWSSIPIQVVTQINNCSNKNRYIKEVNFGPTGAWYIHGIRRDKTGAHSWWGETKADSGMKIHSSDSARLQASFGSDNYGNETYALLSGRNGYSLSSNLSQNLTERIERLYNQNKAIKFIRLFTNNCYYISDDEGSQWSIVPTHCANELRGGGEVEDVAIAGDTSWVVIRPNRFDSSTGVDSRLTERLARFYREQRQRVERRKQEIREYYERIEREIKERREREEREAEELRLRAEREAQEAAERAEREAQEAAERAEREAQEARERAEREAQEAAEKERAESEARIAKEEAEKQARVGKLEEILESKLLQEVETIRELEEHVQKRKRMLKAHIQELPVSKRFRFDDGLSSHVSVGKGSAECVVCHDNAASRAVVPCGHHCLCDECAELLTFHAQMTSRLCPLCRGVLTSTLKIFAMK